MRCSVKQGLRGGLKSSTASSSLMPARRPGFLDRRAARNAEKPARRLGFLDLRNDACGEAWCPR